MSGHSKWATIKHKKGKTDAQRGKIFTKIIREITSAVRAGGGPDPNSNPRLRLAIDKAKDANMPNDNYERAIIKASGGGDGAALEEVAYEGYGPAGVAIMVEAITDNKQRTVSEVRNVFSKNGGNLGAAGCVSYIFTRKGRLNFDKKTNEESLTMAAIDAGAEDIKAEDGSIEVETTPENFEKVKTELKKQGFTPATSELALVPSTLVTVTGEDARKAIKLVEALEDNDDVQNVYANFDVPDDILE
ncbi:YebC/PmpR family DNA-binding transcriptional regulator [Candidatus Saganbacteria bacterium]|nr:YebC/PmpR family DNA-binding transcriptional regulator [Candidatus Saganbacteria bacterium]